MSLKNEHLNHIRFLLRSTDKNERKKMNFYHNSPFSNYLTPRANLYNQYPLRHPVTIERLERSIKKAKLHSSVDNKIPFPFLLNSYNSLYSQLSNKAKRIFVPLLKSKKTQVSLRRRGRSLENFRKAYNNSSLDPAKIVKLSSIFRISLLMKEKAYFIRWRKRWFFKTAAAASKFMKNAALQQNNITQHSVISEDKHDKTEGNKENIKDNNSVDIQNDQNGNKEDQNETINPPDNLAHDKPNTKENNEDDINKLDEKKDEIDESLQKSNNKEENTTKSNPNQNNKSEKRHKKKHYRKDASKIDRYSYTYYDSNCSNQEYTASDSYSPYSALSDNTSYYSSKYSSEYYQPSYDYMSVSQSKPSDSIKENIKEKKPLKENNIKINTKDDKSSKNDKKQRKKNTNNEKHHKINEYSEFYDAYTASQSSQNEYNSYYSQYSLKDSKSYDSQYSKTDNSNYTNQYYSSDNRSYISNLTNADDGSYTYNYSNLYSSDTLNQSDKSTKKSNPRSEYSDTNQSDTNKSSTTGESSTALDDTFKRNDNKNGGKTSEKTKKISKNKIKSDYNASNLNEQKTVASSKELSNKNKDSHNQNQNREKRGKNSISKDLENSATKDKQAVVNETQKHSNKKSNKCKNDKKKSSEEVQNNNKSNYSEDYYSEYESDINNSFNSYEYGNTLYTTEYSDSYNYEFTESENESINSDIIDNSTNKLNDNKTNSNIKNSKSSFKRDSSLLKSSKKNKLNPSPLSHGSNKRTSNVNVPPSISSQKNLKNSFSSNASPSFDNKNSKRAYLSQQKTVKNSPLHTKMNASDNISPNNKSNQNQRKNDAMIPKNNTSDKKQTISSKNKSKQTTPNSKQNNQVTPTKDKGKSAVNISKKVTFNKTPTQKKYEYDYYSDPPYSVNYYSDYSYDENEYDDDDIRPTKNENSISVMNLNKTNSSNISPSIARNFKVQDTENISFLANSDIKRSNNKSLLATDKHYSSNNSMSLSNNNTTKRVSDNNSNSFVSPIHNQVDNYSLPKSGSLTSPQTSLFHTTQFQKTLTTLETPFKDSLAASPITYSKVSNDNLDLTDLYSSTNLYTWSLDNESDPEFRSLIEKSRYYESKYSGTKINISGIKNNNEYSDYINTDANLSTSNYQKAFDSSLHGLHEFDNDIPTKDISPPLYCNVTK